MNRTRRGRGARRPVPRRCALGPGAALRRRRGGRAKLVVRGPFQRFRRQKLQLLRLSRLELLTAGRTDRSSVDEECSAVPGARFWGSRLPGPSHSGRGFNLFKPLRRHFRAFRLPGTPLCRQALSRRDPSDRNAAVQKTDDRLFPPGLRHASHAQRFDRSVTNGGGRNGFDKTGQHGGLLQDGMMFRTASREQT
jgi:hypothetical protein